MTKVTFRCKRSGNCVSFSLESDIAGLRKHEGYEEVINGNPIEKTTEAAPERAEGLADNPRQAKDENHVGKKDDEKRPVLKKRKVKDESLI